MGAADSAVGGCRITAIAGQLLAGPRLEAEELTGHFQARLQEVGIHANPFEAAVLQLLLQAANGLPWLLNHLAQRALEEAAAQNSRAVMAAHL